MSRPSPNFEPVGSGGNVYDFGSAEDRLVEDPLSDQFLGLWNATARTNTTVFGQVFHPVPHDDVRTWKDYDSFYEHFFHEADAEALSSKSPAGPGNEGGEGEGETARGIKKKQPAKYKWGHVVAENFSPGAQGAGEVKELLSRVKGTLVEMPLLFLIKEDIAKEGVGLNAFTEEVYT